MFGLVDASGMFASCEKVFDPSIRDKPVVVLSNNDGCIVAVCPIAKRLGIAKFGPYFKVKAALDQLGVVARSSNYELYSDLSQRMMETCARFAPEQYIYSIDESFLRYQGYVPPEGWFELGRSIRRTIWKEVRLPVGVGFANTLTLAKAANHASKKLPGFKGVAVIDNEGMRRHILKQMEVTDIWGVGRRIGKRLQDMGIKTGWDLAQTRPSRMRKEFSVLIENSVYELNGEEKFSFDEVRPAKQQIFSTRSFGQRVCELNLLKQAVINHVGIAAQKLRAQNGLVYSMLIFAHNSPHDREPFYRRSVLHRFAVPTCDTGVMAGAAAQHMAELFNPSVRFYKCGVGLIEIVESSPLQSDLFSPSADRMELMGCLDAINKKYGRNTVHIAGQGIEQKFSMRRELLSPQYTTRIKDLPIFHCDE